MRNKHPGTCYRCGEHCPAGEGHFERKPGGGWRVQHADCAIKHRGTDVGKPGESDKREAMRLARLRAQAGQTGKKGQRARYRLRREGHPIGESRGEGQSPTGARLLQGGEADGADRPHERTKI